MSELSVLDTSPEFKKLVSGWLDVIDANLADEDDTDLRENIAVEANEIASRYPSEIRNSMLGYLIRGSLMLAQDIRVESRAITPGDIYD
jgi:hypothetical protein